jgi:repressor LexA
MFGSSQTASLTDRQRAVLDVVVNHLSVHGYPPTVREICDAVGLASPSTVHAHLAALERAGLLERDPTKPRALKLAESTSAVSLPILGQVAAGAPIVAEERYDGSVTVPAHLVKSGTSFIVDVRGDSMVGAGILDGDQVVVRSQPDAQDGQIVVALVDGEATCKRIRKADSGVELHSENPQYDPIIAHDVSLMGIVTGVVRAL